MAAESSYVMASTADGGGAAGVDDVFDSELPLSPPAESEEASEPASPSPCDAASPSPSSPLSPIPCWTPPLRRHARRPSATLTRTRSLPETNSVLGRRLPDTAMPLTGSPLRRTSAPTLAPELLTEPSLAASAAGTTAPASGGGFTAAPVATSALAVAEAASLPAVAAPLPTATTTVAAVGELASPVSSSPLATPSGGAEARTRRSEVALLGDTLAKASIDSGLGEDCHLRPVVQREDAPSPQAMSASPVRRRVSFDPMVIGRELNRALQQMLNPRLPPARRAHLQTLVRDLQRELETAAAESRSRRSQTASPCGSGRRREGSESGSDCFDLVSEEDAFEDEEEDDDDEEEDDDEEQDDDQGGAGGGSSSDDDEHVHNL